MVLTENKPSREALTPGQVDALAKHVPELTIVPVRGTPGLYDLTPSQFVGRVDLPDLVVDIRPKIPIRSMMFMLAYIIDAKHWRDLYATFAAESGPLDAMAAAFGRELSRTLSRGLLRGYTARQETLSVVRGRIVVPEQLRRWFGEIPPVECAYDEFTEDILENRLLKSALEVLRRIRVRNAQTRAELAHAEMHLENVTAVPFDPRALPQVTQTRLNDRFRRALEIAKLILQSTTVETGRQGVTASAFLVDLAGVFETFVLTGLRESRALAPWSLPHRKEHRFLDVGGRLRLIPDLAFRHGGEIVAVGDVKYKRTPSVGVLHPDVYQVLAYAVAFDLSHSFLVYPVGDEESEPGSHVVRHVEKFLHVLKLNLDSAPTELLGHVEQMAASIRAYATVAA